MRNIAEYPLTPEDLISTLKHAQRDYNSKGMFGGVDGLVYSQLLDFLKDEDNAQLVLNFKPVNK